MTDNKYDFQSEDDLKEYVAERMAEIRAIFADVTAAERSFYGHSPLRAKADRLKGLKPRLVDTIKH